MIIIANLKANIVDKFPVENDKVIVAAAYPQVTTCAQDLSMFPPGAYTGEVPAELLKKLGVKYSLVGHSERRKYLGETTEMVGKKMERCLENNIIPIICAQKFEEIPELAINTPGEKYLVMFEPFEAISNDGKYNAVTPEAVKKTLIEWKDKLPNGVEFLYGGSVNSGNVKDYVSIVSGFVVGHASLDLEEFSKIVNYVDASAH